MRDFNRGLLDGAPIVIGYLAIGTPFGLLATKAGIPLWGTFLMSLLCYGGSAQFVAIKLIPE